jgi:hypothetical protein
MMIFAPAQHSFDPIYRTCVCFHKFEKIFTTRRLQTYQVALLSGSSCSTGATTFGTEGAADDPLTGFALSCSACAGFCELPVSLEAVATTVTGVLAFFFTARPNADEYAAKAPGTGTGIPASL